MTSQKTTAKDFLHLKQIPDPPKEPDMRQNNTLLRAFPALFAHFANRDDVLLAGGGYILRETGQGIRGAFAPDLVFTESVEYPEAIIQRNGYVISEVGKPPDFVLEVASEGTGSRDYTVKRTGYAALGVREYWRFDCSGGRFHDAPLAGDALVDERYEPMPITTEPDGRHWGYSPILGLELWWERESGREFGELTFRDPITGEFLRHPAEQELALRAAEEQAREANSRAYFAESLVDSERAARIAAEARIAAMEAELRQLRDE